MIIFQCLLLIPTLLSVASGWFDPRVYNGTKVWSSVRYIDETPPLALESGGHLVHVLDAADPSHALRFEATNLTTCRPDLRLAYPARYPRHAISLANGKLVVWLLNYRMTPYRHIADWRFLIVDPSVCSYAGFNIRDSDPLPIDVVDVVGYDDNFDVFLVGLAEEEPRKLYVYRYKDDGSPASSAVVSVIPDVDSGPFYRPNAIRVYTVFKHDPSHGYFYIHARPDLNTTTVKRLDTNFVTERSIEIHHPTPLIYSTSHANVTVCYFELNDNKTQLQCNLYDEWLNEVRWLSLNYTADANLNLGKRVYTTLENLPGGGAVLLHALEVDNRTATLVIGQRLYANGSASSIMEFDKVNCQIYGLRVFHIPDGNHCITVSCDETINTRCGYIE